jgi:Spy/CpxP family protein refolding chaperone
MKKSVIAVMSGAALCVTLVASASGTQDQDRRMQRCATGIVIRHIERQLNITTDQRTQIKAILEQEKPTIQTLAARVQEQNAELAQMPYFNEAEVRAFARQHVATMEDVLVEREKVRVEVLQVLNPEQRQKLQHIRKTRTAEFAQQLSTLGDQL